MLNKKEIGSIIALTIVLGFTLSLLASLEIFLYTALFVLIIILVNTFAKKLASYYLDSQIEVGLWEIKQWGFRKHWRFKKGFPMGIFMPLVTTILSFGWFNWMAGLVFDVKPKTYRAAKRHELYAFSEMTEWHIGLIAAAGVFANLIFAVIGYLVGLPDFARLNIYYAFFNMIPFSSLDGNKIFFGSLALWSFLATIVLIIVAGVLLIA
ncbi:hypothetical protein ACFLZJ_00040 [Nanoarchaeota archaeon]